MPPLWICGRENRFRDASKKLVGSITASRVVEEPSRTEYKHITVAQCYNTINLDVPICPAKSPNKVLADLRSAEADQRKLSA